MRDQFSFLPLHCSQGLTQPESSELVWTPVFHLQLLSPAWKVLTLKPQTTPSCSGRAVGGTQETAMSHPLFSRSVSGLDL